MTGETRIALLLGLIFIFAFGLVLSELTGNAVSEPIPATRMRDVEYLARTPNLDDRAPSHVPGARADDFRTVPRQQPAQARVADHQSPVRYGRDEQGSVSVTLLHDRGHAQPRRHEDDRAPTSPYPPQPAPATRTHVVQAGETFYSIARLVYGSEGHWQRIYEANRDIVASPTRLPVGVEIRLPDAPPIPTHPHYREVGLEELAREVRGPRTYVIRPGDNLTKIARETLGDGSRSAVQRIYQANRERIADPNVLQVGMELEIPS